MPPAKSKQKGMDPRKLRPMDMARLINATPLGKVTTTQTINNWVTAGFPKNSDGKTVDLVTLAAWLAKERKRGNVDSDDGTRERRAELIAAQTNAARATAERNEAKRAIEMEAHRLKLGELIPREEVDEHQRQCAIYTVDVIEGLASQASRLQGLTLPEIRKELKAIVKEMRDALIAE